MESFVRRFIRSSLIWLAIGASLGVAMVYHIIPRFSGHPLHNRGLAALHLWIANAGLALLVAGEVRAFAGAACRAGSRVV